MLAGERFVSTAVGQECWHDARGCSRCQSRQFKINQNVSCARRYFQVEWKMTMPIFRFVRCCQCCRLHTTAWQAGRDHLAMQHAACSVHVHNEEVYPERGTGEETYLCIRLVFGPVPAVDKSGGAFCRAGWMGEKIYKLRSANTSGGV